MAKYMYAPCMFYGTPFAAVTEEKKKVSLKVKDGKGELFFKNFVIHAIVFEKMWTKQCLGVE
jgi:hypothetical protein